MRVKRKQYIIDKKFQISLSLKAMLLPLFITLIIGSVLLYFAHVNSNYSRDIVQNQEQMIELFLTTPALYNIENPIIRSAQQTFKDNIRMIVEMRKNSKLVLYFIVIMIIIQSSIIFLLFVFITHRISGPIHVMVQYLREVKKGKIPKVRPLRKKDELQEFYKELYETIDYLFSKEPMK